MKGSTGKWVVTKNENNGNNDNSENNIKDNITLNDTIMQEDHNSLITESFKRKKKILIT